MAAFAFLIARLTSSAWVGAAVLFVIVAVRQTTSGLFDHQVLAQLALLRFGPYYLTGGILITAALASSLLIPGEALRVARRACILLSLAGAMGVMIYDYQTVYRPLTTMLQESLQKPQSTGKPASVEPATAESATAEATLAKSMSYLKPGSPLSANLPPEFVALHRKSERLNTLQLGLVMLAALLLNWPLSRRKEPESVAR